jgi:hypothetical protein
MVGAVISTTVLTAPWLLQEIYVTAALGLFHRQSQGLQRNEALLLSLIFNQRHASSVQGAISLFILTKHPAFAQSEHHRTKNLDNSTYRVQDHCKYVSTFCGTCGMVQFIDN